MILSRFFCDKSVNSNIILIFLSIFFASLFSSLISCSIILSRLDSIFDCFLIMLISLSRLILSLLSDLHKTMVDETKSINMMKNMNLFSRVFISNSIT